MKKLALLAAAATVALGAAAQNTVVNNPDNKAYLGIRLSADALIPGNVKAENVSLKELGAGPGVSLGAVYNIPIVANFTVEPGVEFYYGAESIEESALGNFNYKNRSLRQFGMRVPVMLGYHFDFSRDCSLNVFTGPLLNVGITNDYYTTTKLNDVGVSNHWSGSMYNDEGLNRVSGAWRLGLGFTYKQKYYVALSGDMGFTNLLKNNANGNVTMKQNGFHFTLGYNF